MDRQYNYDSNRVSKSASSTWKVPRLRALIFHRRILQEKSCSSNKNGSHILHDKKSNFYQRTRQTLSLRDHVCLPYLRYNSRISFLFCYSLSIFYLFFFLSLFSIFLSFHFSFFISIFFFFPFFIKFQATIGSSTSPGFPVCFTGILSPLRIFFFESRRHIKVGCSWTPLELSPFFWPL